MNTQTSLPGATRPTDAALVWIDDDHAVVVSGEADGTNTVECFERAPDESINRFEARTADQVMDEARVIVSGPAFARTSFERVYVAVTHRPDRLVDLEARSWSADPLAANGP